MSDEENSKDVTDKDEDKTSEIKELTSRENYVLRARQWCTTLREKTKRKRETSTSSNPSDKGTQNQKKGKGKRRRECTSESKKARKVRTKNKSGETLTSKVSTTSTPETHYNNREASIDKTDSTPLC